MERLDTPVTEVSHLEAEKDSTPLLTVELLRALFKNLYQFRAFHEDTGLSFFRGPGGVEWSIWDIEVLYEATQTILARQQSNAIRLFLVENLFEADAAERMGVSRTNPVGMYATDGLRRIVFLANNRLIKNYRSGG